jgi:hypothetical protein
MIREHMSQPTGNARLTGYTDEVNRVTIARYICLKITKLKIMMNMGALASPIPRRTPA